MPTGGSAPTISYWNGAGYSTDDARAGCAAVDLPVASVNINDPGFPGGPLTIDITADRLDRRNREERSRRRELCGARASAPSASAQSASPIVGDITYKITHNGVDPRGPDHSRRPRRPARADLLQGGARVPADPRRETRRAGSRRIEVVMTTAVLSIVMAMSMAFLVSAQRTVTVADTRSNNVDQARLGVQQLDRQIRSGNLIYNPGSENDPANGI